MSYGLITILRFKTLMLTAQMIRTAASQAQRRHCVDGQCKGWPSDAVGALSAQNVGGAWTAGATRATARRARQTHAWGRQPSLA
eukprot:6209731-Pleurochrysis_carterae.AAC.2